MINGENVLLIFEGKCYLFKNPTQEIIDVLEDSCGNRCDNDEYAWNLAVDKLILAILTKKTPMRVIIRLLNIYTKNDKQVIKKWLGAFNEFFISQSICETINKTYINNIELVVFYKDSCILADKKIEPLGKYLR